MSLARRLLMSAGAGGSSPEEPDPFWADVDTLIQVVDGSIVDAKGKIVGVAAVTTYTDGGLENSYVMDFSNVSSSHLTIPGSSTFNFLHDGSTSWTIDTYVKRFYTYNTRHPIFSTGRQNYYPGVGCTMYGENLAYYMKAPFTAIASEDIDLDLTNATWYHLEIAFDKDNACMYGFIDGNLVSTQPVTGDHSLEDHGEEAYETGFMFIGLTSGAFVGRMGAFRVTKALRHSESFTKPSPFFPTS